VQRARHEAKTVEEAEAIAKRVAERRASILRQRGADRRALRLVTATNVADRLWRSRSCASTAASSRWTRIKRIGRYTVPFDVFANVVAEFASSSRRKARSCRLRRARRTRGG